MVKLTKYKLIIKYAENINIMKKLFILIIAFYTIANCYSQTISKYLGNAITKHYYDKDYKGALDYYNKAIELDTTNCSYLYMVRGELKFILKDYKGAISDYDVAIKNDHNCKYTFGGEKEGDATFETEVVSDSKLYLNRGETKAKLEDYFGAIADFNEAIKFKSNYNEAYFYRGKTKAKLQDYRGAISDYNKAINIYPAYTIIYYYRGNAKFDLKDYEGAILDYTKQIQLYPDNSPEEYYNRGLAKLNLKQKNSGCLDLSKAGELGYEGAYEAIKKYCN